MTAPLLRQAAVIVVTFAVSLAGVFVAQKLSLPLPWMIGPLLATAGARMSGLRVGGMPLSIPQASRVFFIPVLGVMIASRFTPEIVAGLSTWWKSLLCIPAYVIALQLINFAVFRKLGRYDPATAFFAASPGGMVESVMLGEKAGGSMSHIAVQHSARVFLAMLLVPFMLSMIGFGYDRTPPPAREIEPSLDYLADIALIAAAAVLGVFAAGKLRLPAAPMMGPFFLASILYGAQLVEAQLPTVLINLSQLVIGGTLGARFGPEDRTILLRSAGLALVAFVTAMAGAGVVALLLTGLGIASLPAMFLSFAPGGLTEMSLVAIALHIDPVFVAVHHLARILSTVMIAPLVFRLFIERPAGG